MLPFVVQKCTEFLWSDLSAKNVCRAFEFAKLFEEPELAERCLQVTIRHFLACLLKLLHQLKCEHLCLLFRLFAHKQMMF